MIRQRTMDLRNAPRDKTAERRVLEAARDRLVKSPYRTLRGVSCDLDHGVLRLSGRLPSYYYKQMAQEAVADLHGISQVVNETDVSL